jgi:hypothetical protein
MLDRVHQKMRIHYWQKQRLFSLAITSYRDAEASPQPHFLCALREAGDSGIDSHQRDCSSHNS